MQLTEKTLSILKNYASIQPNLVVEEGNQIKTMAEARNVMSSAELDQEFPVSFGIYDLSEFLGVLSLVDSPDVSFSDQYLTVQDSSGTAKVRFWYSSPDMLTHPKKDLQMPPAEVTFKLSQNTLDRIRRASSTLGHDKMVIEPNDGSILISVTDTTDSTCNSFKIEVPGSYESDEFQFVMGIPNIKVIPGDYDVSVSSKLISKFEGTSGDIRYFIALEKSSTYGG